MIAENIILLADEMYAELLDNMNDTLSDKPNYITEFNLEDLTIEQLNDLSETLVDKLSNAVLVNPMVENVEISITVTTKGEVSIEENLIEYVNHHLPD
jgi:gamma-glutamyl phosphate reductase